MVLEKKKHW